MVTAITDIDTTYLQVTNDGVNLRIKKLYVDVRLNADDPNIIDFRWHWYELNSGQRLFYLDYTRFTPIFYASAAALLADIDLMLVSQFSGGVQNSNASIQIFAHNNFR